MKNLALANARLKLFSSNTSCFYNFFNNYCAIASCRVAFCCGLINNFGSVLLFSLSFISFFFVTAREERYACDYSE